MLTDGIKRLAAGTGERHVVEVTAHLLLESLRDQRQLNADRGTVVTIRLMDELRDEVYELCRAIEDESLQSSDLKDLAELGERYIRSSGLSEVATARALAEGLDRSHGTRFFGYFTDRGERLYGPSEPIPVSIPSLKVLGGRRPNTRPDRLGPENRNLAHLRLLPADLAGRKVRLLPVMDTFGQLLHAPLRIALLIPNGEISEVSFELERQRGRFFWVRPADEVKQQHTILELLTDAERRGAHAAVLPELSTTPNLVDTLTTWMAKPERRLKILVAGSYHCEQSGVRRNIVQILGRSGPLMQHKKFNPFSVNIEDTRYTEDIATGDASIALAAHQSCIFTSMICKDLLAPGVIELLSRVGVDLLLAPSFSQKTAAFSSGVMSLSTNAQAIAAIATFVFSDESNERENQPAVGLVSIPTLEGSCSQVFRAEIDPPLTLIFDTSVPRQEAPWVDAWSKNT